MVLRTARWQLSFDGIIRGSTFRDCAELGSSGRALCGAGRADSEDAAPQTSQQRSDCTDAPNPATQKRGPRKQVHSKFANGTTPSEDLCRLRCVPEKRQVLRYLCN